MTVDEYGYEIHEGLQTDGQGFGFYTGLPTGFEPARISDFIQVNPGNELYPDEFYTIRANLFYLLKSNGVYRPHLFNNESRWQINAYIKLNLIFINKPNKNNSNECESKIKAAV
jgi:hypothetical protein